MPIAGTKVSVTEYGGHGSSSSSTTFTGVKQKTSTGGAGGGSSLAFAFGTIFGAHASQADVFRECGGMVQSALGGYLVCVFAYGQTGVGEPHTLLGPAGGSGIELFHAHFPGSPGFTSSDSRGNSISQARFSDVYRNPTKHPQLGPAPRTIENIFGYLPKTLGADRGEDTETDPQGGEQTTVLNRHKYEQNAQLDEAVRAGSDSPAWYKRMLGGPIPARVSNVYAQVSEGSWDLLGARLKRSPQFAVDGTPHAAPQNLGAQPTQHICPFCNVGAPDTLEHFLGECPYWVGQLGPAADPIALQRRPAIVAAVLERRRKLAGPTRFGPGRPETSET